MLSLAIPGAHAGGGPSGYLVIYNPTNSSSVTMANHYQQVRGIPERNMFPYDFSGFSTAQAWNFVYAIRQALVDRGIASQFQGIALIGPNPSSSNQTFGDYNGTSLQSFLFLSPNYENTNYPSDIHIPQPVSYHEPPLQPTTTLAGNIPIGGKTYWPISCVGHTGKGGNTLRDVLAYIDRAKSHDGAKPDGTVYWCLSTDPYRTPPREPELAEVVPVWKHLGIRYTVTKSSWVSGRPDIVGGIVGDDSVTPGAGGNRFLAGAWADHLTSYGGTLDSYPGADGVSGQMIISAWLRAGADGSSGTFSEPENDPAKFTNGHIHSHFRVGCSLAEAFWQSIKTPAEIVALGDPLLQPYADFPKVTISAPAQDASLSGTVAVTVSAVATGGKTLEANRDLFVDGRRIAIGNGSETVSATRTSGGFTLNTTTLSDGWHELRVAAYNSDPIRTQAEAAVGVAVNNHGQSLAISGPSSVDIPGTSNFAVAAAGSPLPTSIDLRMNGRILGTITAASGTINVDGSKFPLSGVGTLYAVGKLSNGQEISSRPFQITPNWAAQPAVVSPVLGSAFATIRYFASTKSGFSWDSSVPTAIVPFAGDSTSGLRFAAGSPPPNISISDYTTTPGFEADMLFYAPMDDWYDFSASVTSGQAAPESFSMDGQLATLERVQHLAIGWHRLQIRFKVSNSNWSFKLYQRGGPCTYYAPIPLTRGAAEGDGSGGTPPQITSAAATASTITGAAVQLNATAANSTGLESALIYTWSLVDGPGGVTFSPNGTNASKSTLATFTKAGTYSLGLQASNSTTASSLATVTVTVQQTATKLVIAGPVTSGNTNVIAGYPVDFIATVVDQFNQPMPLQPAINWTTTAPGGAVTPAGSRQVVFRSAATVGTYTVTATDATNSSRTATWSNIKTTANVAPVLSGLTISRPVITQPITLKMVGSDADDPDRIYVSYKWAVSSAPAGKSMTIADDYFPITTATPSGPGTYVLTTTITDGAGASATKTTTLQIASDGTLSSSPVISKPGNLTPTVPNGDTKAISVTVSGGSITYQWQISKDGGNTWKDIAGATDSTYLIGPVTSSDNGNRYQVIASNSGGSSISPTFILMVSNPVGGVVGVTGGTAWENAGYAVFTIWRKGGTSGTLTASYTIDSTGEFPATAGLDYGGAKTGTVTWAAGDGADKQVLIPIINDSIQDKGPSGALAPSEQFYLYITGLTSQGNVAVRSSSFSYDYFYILDDDGPGVPAFSSTPYEVREDQEVIVLTVKRVHGSLGSLTATYGITGSSPAGVPSTATAGADFTSVSGVLTWSNGATDDKQIVIPISRDLLTEAQETFNVYVQDDAGDVDHTQVLIDDVPTTAFDLWQSQWWQGETNPTVIGDSADPDGDGIPNLLEYAIGSDPIYVTSFGRPVVEVENNRLQIVFTRAAQASDVVYHVDASDDMNVWDEIWNSTNVPYDGEGAPTETVTVPDVQMLDGSGIIKRFLRLRVSR